MVVFRVRCGALQKLDEQFAGALAGVHEYRCGCADVLTANQIAYDLNFARGDTGMP